MQTLTSKERIHRIINLEPVDRIGLFEQFWEDTAGHWREQGYLAENESPEDHFGFDIRFVWPFNLTANLDMTEEVIEETEDKILARDGNGAFLKRWKHKTGTPEHVDFTVKDRSGWEELIKPRLLNKDDYRRRINFEAYRQIYAKCKREDLFLCWAGVNVFESMHPVCGHEYMLMGMALDPDWVRDMCHVYADLAIDLMETLFAEEGKPDAVWFFEDMGFKAKPFMSPAMYRDIIWPSHKRTFDYVHAIGSKVIVHSCGFVEALVPGLIEAGMDCLQAMEIKAGMNLLEMKKKYGDQIALFGGLDVRTLESNDPSQVTEMLQTQLPVVMEPSGYILHTDHSIPTSVNYHTYKHFVEKGLEIGTY